MEYLKNLYKQVRSFFARVINVMDRATEDAIMVARRNPTNVNYVKAIAMTVADVVVCALFGRLVGFVLGTICCAILGVAGILIALPLAIFFILDTFKAARDMRNGAASSFTRNACAA